MKTIAVRHYQVYDAKFDNWESEVLDRWTYDDFLRDPRYKKEWISITSLAYHAPSDTVYLGIGSFSTELLWKLDRASGIISSCGYERVGDAYDGKLHRSLELDGDTLYGGVALFHDIDKQFVAPGGRLIRYDIPTGSFTLTEPVCPPAYIQSIALDRERQRIYGFGALPEIFFRHDLKTGESKLIAHIGNGCELAQAHNPVIAPDGTVWGTYGILRAFSYRTGPDSIRLFRYLPEEDRMEFLPYGYPVTGEAGDKGKPDTSLTGPDGRIYTGTDFGLLVRLDPRTGETKALCKPHPTQKRLAALAFSPRDGLLYGLAGEHYDVKLFAYNTCTEQLEGRWDVEQGSLRPDRIHQMVFTADGTIYAGENDNNDRSAYLWEITLTEQGARNP